MYSVSYGQYISLQKIFTGYQNCIISACQNSLSKTRRDADTDAGTALMFADASSAVPSSVPVSVNAN